MVQPGKIITAAHCVYYIDGKKATSIKAIFGKNGVYSAGVYSVTADANSYTYSQNWAKNMTSENDYAVIKVNTAVSDATGYFGLSINLPTNCNYNLTGYPFISGYSNYTQEYMYTDNGFLTETPGTNDFVHPFNSSSSVSGSPIYNDDLYIVGMHTWGNSDIGYSWGIGTRVTTELFNMVVYS